ncbi:hypothetical protein [Nocardia tengchongensis]|uniref:hypothetical protein n=1 Tax=Nocardia tengchongensis TaxID=2055889 RepID=UPI003678894D
MFRTQTAGMTMSRILPSGELPAEGYRATYPELLESGEVTDREMLIEGDYDLLERAFDPGLNRLYLGYGMWRLIGSAAQLTLIVYHEAQIAPVWVDPMSGSASSACGST